MKTEAEFRPLPSEFLSHRDRLRVAGYELVRYSRTHAQAESSRYRHSFGDYEHAIHKIESIEAETGQIIINENASYSSADQVSSWAEYHIEKYKPEGFGLLRRWFKDPAYLALTVIVPPYGLTMLGLAAAGDRAKKKAQDARKQSLLNLSETPRFLRRYRHGA